MVLNVLTAYLTTLKHIILIAENVCNPKSHPKSECSRCCFIFHPKMLVIHIKLSPISLLFCHLMIDFFLTYIFLPNVSVFSSNYFFQSQILFSWFLFPASQFLCLFIWAERLCRKIFSFQCQLPCIELPIIFNWGWRDFFCVSIWSGFTGANWDYFVVPYML